LLICFSKCSNVFIDKKNQFVMVCFSDIDDEGRWHYIKEDVEILIDSHPIRDRDENLVYHVSTTKPKKLSGRVVAFPYDNSHVEDCPETRNRVAMAAFVRVILLALRGKASMHDAHPDFSRNLLLSQPV